LVFWKKQKNASRNLEKNWNYLLFLKRLEWAYHVVCQRSYVAERLIQFNKSAIKSSYLPVVHHILGKKNYTFVRVITKKYGADSFQQLKLARSEEFI